MLPSARLFSFYAKIVDAPEHDFLLTFGYIAADKRCNESLNVALYVFRACFRQLLSNFVHINTYNFYYKSKLLKVLGEPI